MVHLTSNAAGQIQTIINERGLNPQQGGLRLTVEKGGCSGMQYVMEFDKIHEGDEVFVENNARIFVAQESLKFLDGSTIDYQDGLSSAGFKILNPNAKRSCGCGTSFEA